MGVGIPRSRYQVIVDRVDHFGLAVLFVGLLLLLHAIPMNASNIPHIGVDSRMPNQRFIGSKLYVLPC